MTKRLRVVSKIGYATSGRGRAQYASYSSYVGDVKASVKQMTDAMMDIFNQFEDASEDIMLEALRPTFELSKKYCPVDTGEMIASGYLEKVGFRGKPRVEIGYAKGGYPDYTVYVHEMIDIPHREPTRAKWLQSAVMEDLDNIEKRIGAGYHAFMNGGTQGAPS